MYKGNAGEHEEKVEACGGVAAKGGTVRSLCAASRGKDGGKKERGRMEESVVVLGGWRESSGWNCTQEHEPVSTHTLHVATSHTLVPQQPHTHTLFLSCPTAEHIT